MPTPLTARKKERIVKKIRERDTFIKVVITFTCFTFTYYMPPKIDATETSPTFKKTGIITNGQDPNVAD